MRPVLLVLLAVGCGSENDLIGKDRDPAPFDTGTTSGVDTSTDSSPPPPVEECNGVDDDGDGVVDEGFPDDDANGRADCQDVTCPALDLAEAGPVPINEVCQGTTGGGGTEVKNPWNVRVQWTYGPGLSSWMTPVIGNLDDDDGDGDVDEDDSPDIVISLSNNTVVALDGATGTEKWTYRNGNGYAGTSIADVDGDGFPDVVTADTQGRTITLEGDGTLKWTADDMLVALNYMLHNVADLDEDGTPEVIHDEVILSGVDGRELNRMSPRSSSGQTYRLPAIGDVDNDGDQEIALQGALFDSDGSLLWDSGEVGTYGFWPILIQADADPEAEIGFVGEYWSLFEADGTLIYQTRYNTTAQPGPPCAGDFDGDGTAEVAWPAFQNFVMYELDGTQVWSVPMDDTSGLAGCSGYDLNNDGALEILFADQSTFTIFDGATGAELFVDPTHRSPTIFEYPTIADIDHDDHAEILVAHYGGSVALTAYEHDGDGWPAAGTTWNVHDFAITNINPDGSVPRNPDESWLAYNVYRARVAADDPSTPDLQARVTDVCVADCTYGPVQVAVEVWNEGGADVRAGVELRLYSDDATGRREVASTTLPDVPAGTSLDGITFDLTPADVGSLGWYVSIDPTNAENECDETNNDDQWTDAICL
jgi:hypothetical protein